MKKRKIVSILVFNLLLLEGTNLKSEEVIDGTATVNLGETVVPRKKIGRDGNLEEKFSKSNKNYTQKITENEIKESGASNIFELLQKTTTLNIKNGFIGTGVIDLRGYGETAFGNTKILLDGISINPIDGSGIDINSIPLENIKLIEIWYYDIKNIEKILSKELKKALDKPLNISVSRHAKAFGVARQTAHEAILSAEKNLFDR